MEGNGETPNAVVPFDLNGSDQEINVSDAGQVNIVELSPIGDEISALFLPPEDDESEEEEEFELLI